MKLPARSSVVAAHPSPTRRGGDVLWYNLEMSTDVELLEEWEWVGRLAAIRRIIGTVHLVASGDLGCSCEARDTALCVHATTREVGPRGFEPRTDRTQWPFQPGYALAH